MQDLDFLCSSINYIGFMHSWQVSWDKVRRTVASITSHLLLVLEIVNFCHIYNVKEQVNQLTCIEQKLL